MDRLHGAGRAVLESAKGLSGAVFRAVRAIVARRCGRPGRLPERKRAPDAPSRVVGGECAGPAFLDNLPGATDAFEFSQW